MVDVYYCSDTQELAFIIWHVNVESTGTRPPVVLFILVLISSVQSSTVLTAKQVSKSWRLSQKYFNIGGRLFFRYARAFIIRHANSQGGIVAITVETLKILS